MGAWGGHSRVLEVRAQRTPLWTQVWGRGHGEPASRAEGTGADEGIRRVRPWGVGAGSREVPGSAAGR